MSDLKSIPAAKILDQTVSLHDVLRTAKISGTLEGFLKETLRRLVVARSAAAAGVQISDAELQQAADSFRQHRGLQKADDAHRWLREHSLSVEDFEQGLTLTIYAEKIRNGIPNEKIEAYFAENRAQYDRAIVSHILVADAGMANEIVTQIQEDDADFADLARKYSTDRTTKDRGGKLGVLHRKSFDPSMESVIFSAADGALVGPVKTKFGHHVIRVEKLLLGELDAPTASAIRDKLFRDWLATEYTKARVEVTLYGKLV